MKNRQDKPICGKTTLEGPKYGRIVAYHGHPCRRLVRVEGEHCWQHGGPPAQGTHEATPDDHHVCTSCGKDVMWGKRKGGWVHVY